MFRNMEYVYAVYKEMSFSRAAEKLFISQPALSAMVKKVEKRIGSPIFDRSCSPIRLTNCGKEYISCIEQIMDVEYQFSQYLNQTEHLLSARCPSAQTASLRLFAPSCMTAFARFYPGIHVSMTEANTDILLDALNAGTLDIVLENYDLPEDMYDKHYLFTENLVLVVPKQLLSGDMLTEYQLDVSQTGRPVNWDDVPCVPLSRFSQLPFLALREGNDTRTRFDRLCARYHLHPDIRLELDQLTTSYQAACSGLGAALISETILHHTAPSRILCAISVWTRIFLPAVFIFIAGEKSTSRARWRNLFASARK